MRAVQILGLSTACLVSVVNVGRGDFIIPSPSGTVLIDPDPNTGEDKVATVNLAGSYRFFDQLRSQVSVAENGNLNFSGDGSFFPSALGLPSVARIAPLWDDFLLDPSLNNRVIEHSVAGSYFAVTWQNVRLYQEVVGSFPATDRSVQVLWFEADTLIRGHLFRQDEIAFSYIGHVAGTDSFGPIFATVGLDAGDGRITPLPGTSRGAIEEADGKLLAWQPNSFLLFQPTGSGGGAGYTASLNFFAVPEPSTFVTLALSACCLCLGRRRNV